MMRFIQHNQSLKSYSWLPGELLCGALNAVG